MGRRGGSVKKNEKEQQMIDPTTASKDQLECAPCFSNFSPELAKDLADLASLGNKILEKTKSPRRSLRIKNGTSSSQDRDIEAVIENIDISDDEEQLDGEQGEQREQEQREQETECFDEQKTEPRVILCARSMEEKIDHLILIIEKQRKTIEALLSKGVANNSCPPENPCTNDTRSDLKSNRYKEMYITSQKKIQELQDEKFELQKKLEAALAKFEGYEKGQDVYSKAVDKLKDVFLVSSLTKATEMALGLSSSQPVASNARATKRKKTES